MCLKYIYWISPRVKDFHWAWNVIFASAVASQATCAVLVGRGTVQPDVSCGLTHQWAHLFSGFVCKDTFSAFTNVFNCFYFSNVLKERPIWCKYFEQTIALEMYVLFFFLRGSSILRPMVSMMSSNSWLFFNSLISWVLLRKRPYLQYSWATLRRNMFLDQNKQHPNS